MRSTGRSGLGHAALLAAGLLVSSPVSTTAQADVQERSRVVHLLSRATYGARQADVAAVLAEGQEAWLEHQLGPARGAERHLEDRLARYPSVVMSMGEMREYGAPRQLLGELLGAKLTRALYSERQLEEVMTDFWFNHFNVFFGKGIARYLVADYERMAIRRHVFGRFEDMLLATAQHPAMLFYLDNWTSVVPDSVNARAPRRPPGAPAGRERGMNENYARELLELHTLGVDGGYTQQDVVEVARALTGWTFTRPGARLQAGAPAGRRGGPPASSPVQARFLFRPLLHDTREKVVLGQTLPAGRGIEDGLDVLKLVASQPSTARFLARKLVERFVTDAPAPEFVDELAGVFLETRGDLRAVTRALFTSARFYDERYVGAKLKTPFELVASALRLTGAELAPSRRLAETLRAFGHLPYAEAAPTGYPATAQAWVNSGAMLSRMNFGIELAAGRIDGVRADVPALSGRSAVDDPAAVKVLLDALLPGAPVENLEASIRAELTHAPGAADPRARALGLILGSPDFQRR